MAAMFIGVGVGPGDPELMTVKAWRLIEQAEVISFISNEQGQSHAKTIAIRALTGNKNTLIEVPVCVPMINDRIVVNKVYDQAAKEIQTHLNAGRTVVFICEGDPLFFGSFAYLLERLEEKNSCQVVPGISSVHAASSTLKVPLTLLKESFSVVSGRHSKQQLETVLLTHDTVVIMKAGRSRQRILQALASTGRTKDARYLEYIGRDNEKVLTDITQLEEQPGPYFSLFIVIRQQRDQS